MDVNSKPLIFVTSLVGKELQTMARLEKSE